MKQSWTERELRSFGSSKTPLFRSTNRTLDVSNDDIDALNSHSIQFEIVWWEAIVRNDNVCIFLGRLYILLKSRLCLVFISFKQLSQRHLLVNLTLCIFQYTSGKSHIIVSVDEKWEIEDVAQFFTAENQCTFYNNHVTWLNFLLSLKPDFVELVINREVKWFTLPQLMHSTLQK